MLTMGGNQVKVFQSLIRTNTNWFVVRSHWRLCSNTEASYSCELTSWHLPRLVERWTGNIPFYGWTELLFSSEAALYHKHVQWLILLKVRLIHSCRKKQDNEILLMLCEIDEPFIYFPKLNFLCLEISWPIPFLMFVLLRNALVTCQVQNSSNTSIIHLPFHNSTPMSSLNP